MALYLLYQSRFASRTCVRIEFVFVGFRYNSTISNFFFKNKIIIKMVRLLALSQQTPLRRRVFLLLLFLFTLVGGSVAEVKETGAQCSDQSAAAEKTTTTTGTGTSRNYYHLVVLVHGYMGSNREQEYLGETLTKQGKELMMQSIANSNDDGDDSSCQQQHGHQFVVLNSKANVNVSTDGIVNGGNRLAAELSGWIQKHATEMQDSDSTTMTLSLIGNSLGGLYSRYALAELYYEQRDIFNQVLPLLFCTTSSPHLGVSQETFIELPKWMEPWVAKTMGQQTIDDLFGVNNSTIVMDMCHSGSNNGIKSDSSDGSGDSKNSEILRDRDYLHPLQQFQKRIAIANAYNTDFLVSVSSAAFLSSEDNGSVHHNQLPDDNASPSTRLMRNIDPVVLQVTTTSASSERKAKITTTESDDIDRVVDDSTRRSCANCLDRLGWHKIFIDTRNIIPGWLRLYTPELVPQVSYSSKELREHFKRYGTLLPVAHPLNMANSRTDWYREITKSGRPIMDALAELLVLDMMHLSEKAA